MDNKNFFAIGASIILVTTLVIYSFQKNKADEASKKVLSNTSALTTLALTTTNSPTPSPFDTASPSATIDKMDDNQNGLVIEDLVVGSGDEATAGKSITVNYKGTFTNGAIFDSSYQRNQPFTFTLGNGQVIKGWDQGFAGMKVGGKRKLTIPPELGYGSRPNGPIPANSTLIFEVELLKVE